MPLQFETTDCMASESVMLTSSFVGETVVEPLLTGVAASCVVMFLNAISILVICLPRVVVVIVWFACNCTTASSEPRCFQRLDGAQVLTDGGPGMVHGLIDPVDDRVDGDVRVRRPSDRDEGEGKETTECEHSFADRRRPRQQAPAIWPRSIKERSMGAVQNTRGSSVWRGRNRLREFAPNGTTGDSRRERGSRQPELGNSPY